MNRLRKQRRDLLREIREKESELGTLQKSLGYLHRQLGVVQSLPEDDRIVQQNLINRDIDNVRSHIRWCENELSSLKEKINETGT